MIERTIKNYFHISLASLKGRSEECIMMINNFYQFKAFRCSRFLDDIYLPRREFVSKTISGKKCHKIFVYHNIRNFTFSFSKISFYDDDDDDDWLAKISSHQTSQPCETIYADDRVSFQVSISLTHFLIRRKSSDR